VDFEDAVDTLEAGLRTAITPRTRGIAAFARAGESPFCLLLPFEIALPNWIGVSSTANIYHLVELKDNYDRYIILLASETNARIIGVNLGSVTTEVCRSRPELRRRVGHEWTQEHYQHHRHERTKLFLHDLIRSLGRVMSAGGYAHLILAGNARVVSAIRRDLPKKLAEKLVDCVSSASNDRLSDIVESTLQSFLDYEELDSQTWAETLITQIRRHGLAVAGTRASMHALRSGRADFLVIAKSYAPGLGWECRSCREPELELPPPDACPVCQTGRIREFEIKGELVRLAEQLQIGVEVVEHSDVLMNLGGVGCLLRYRDPATYLPTAA